MREQSNTATIHRPGEPRLLEWTSDGGGCSIEFGGVSLMFPDRCEALAWLEAARVAVVEARAAA